MWNKDTDAWWGGVLEASIDKGTKDRFDRILSKVPTTAAMQELRLVLKVVKEDWSDRVVQFIDSIERGAYRREFKYKAHKARNTYQCSQVSVLFSLFRQAIHYNDGWREKIYGMMG
jgi:hypothetical protein